MANIFEQDKNKLSLYNELNAPKIDANLFNSDAKESDFEKKGLRYVDIDTLKPFKNHLFKLYEGERYEDMKASIEEHGILTPIIIRPIREEASIVESEFEILSGHNRVKIAQDLGLRRIPAIIKRDLSDEDAMIYAVETNLLQRSFSDMAHSEKAAVLKLQHESMFSQGKRNDIKNELFSIENVGKSDNKSTSSPMGTELRTDEKIGNEYGLSRNNVARYLRISKLIPELLNKVDIGEIPFRAGVDISFLSEEEQGNLHEILSEGFYKINLKNAAALKDFLKSENKLTQLNIIEILDGKKKIKKQKAVMILKPKTLKKYFKPEQKPEEIEAEIIEAIEFYRTHKETGEN